MNIQTDNSLKYNFSDFTFEHYKEILKQAKETHVFSSYTDFNKQDNFLLKRHDIDFSVENARRIAEIEYELGVSSTFFVMLHCEFYNFFERNTIDLIREISSLGHHIGLHFDAKFYDITQESELNKKIAYERSILEYYLDCSVDAFSFHNTTDFTMSCKKWSYGGLINTYADFFQSNVGYCSDSNGIWRFDRMIDFLKSNINTPIQLLTHPAWWTEKKDSPRQKILKCLEDRQKKVFNEYEKTLTSFGRRNVDW